MTKMYCILWDNGQVYEDHSWCLDAYYTTRAEAEKHIEYVKAIAADEDNWYSKDETYQIVERELLDVFIPEKKEP